MNILFVIPLTLLFSQQPLADKAPNQPAKTHSQPTKKVSWNQDIQERLMEQMLKEVANDTNIYYSRYASDLTFSVIFGLMGAGSIVGFSFLNDLVGNYGGTWIGVGIGALIWSLTGLIIYECVINRQRYNESNAHLTQLRKKQLDLMSFNSSSNIINPVFDSLTNIRLGWSLRF